MGGAGGYLRQYRTPACFPYFGGGGGGGGGLVRVVIGDHKICMELQFATPKNVFFWGRMGYVSETTEANRICVCFYHFWSPPPGKRGLRNLHGGGKGYVVFLWVSRRGRTNAMRNLQFFAELGVRGTP